MTAALLVFAYGTVVQVGGGWTRPVSHDAFSLTVLDAAAVVLLLRRPTAGLVLGAFILVTDALANGYANYVVDQSGGVTPGRIGQAVISVLAVALVAALPHTLRASARAT